MTIRWSPTEAEALEDALALAYRYLGRRDRTVAELREHLHGRGIAPGVAEAAVAELRAQGYLDDERYAQRFAEDRRNLDGWGAERIEQRLVAAGIRRELALRAARDRGGEPDAPTELEAAVALLRRRWPEPPADDRERERALGQLVRKGYELELAYDAVRALEREAA